MKQIPALLQADYDQDATTLCLIVRLLTKAGDLYCWTSLDADVVYDPAAYDPHGTGDDWGSATHRADNGFTPSRFQASADMAVDNAELQGFFQDTGITLQQVSAGLFDGAAVRVYQINYMAPEHGHEVMEYGRAGQTKFAQSFWITEFRSLMQLLKQPISNLYSITCRARFGSKAIGTGDGSFEERFPCGKAFTWVSGTVTSVGTNTRLTFTDSALTQADAYFDGGVVEWLTGSNAGAQMEVEAHAADQITMALPMPFAVQVGDTFRVRKDCSKVHDDATNGCAFHWGTEWPLHFRGEPLIPVADGGSNMAPGAQITRA